MTRNKRLTAWERFEELKAKYAKMGLTVGENIKTVRGNRYLYGRVYNRDTGKPEDKYCGPMKPKTLRGVLTEKNVADLRTMLAFYDHDHPGYADALSKVLEAWRAEE